MPKDLESPDEEPISTNSFLKHQHFYWIISLFVCWDDNVIKKSFKYWEAAMKGRRKASHTVDSKRCVGKVLLCAVPPLCESWDPNSFNLIPNLYVLCIDHIDNNPSVVWLPSGSESCQPDVHSE